MKDLVGAQMSESALEVLRRRAESLAAESVEEVVDERVGLLAFSLGEEWYAVGIDHVREIYNEYTLTRVPCVPAHIRGVINIRGEIISVTDLAAMMNVPRAEDAGDGIAIVVQNETSATAMIVDAIADIVEVVRDSVEPPLATIDKGQAEFVTGSVYVDGRLVALVNIDKVLEPIGATA